MTFGLWVMTLFSRSCHDPDNANVPYCDSFYFFFDIHDKSSYLWRFKCNLAMNQAQLLAGDPRRGHMTSCMASSHVMKTIPSITLHRIELETWARCHRVCPVMTHWLICNMIHLVHLSGQIIWPDLGSNFHIDLFWVKTQVLRCVLTRGIRWCFEFSIFVLQRIFAKTLMLLKKTIFLFGLP